MTEDPMHREYQPTRLGEQCQLQSFSMSNGDERWLVRTAGVKGRGMALQQHSNKQKVRQSHARTSDCCIVLRIT